VTESPSNPDPQVAHQHYNNAERDRKNRLWESAISHYNSALRLFPNNPESHLGIGKSYEGLNSGREGEAYLTMALDHYRVSLTHKSDLTEAHDAYITLMIRMGRSDELIREYQARSKEHPEQLIFQTCLKKIRTLLLLSLEPSSSSSAPNPHKMTRVVLNAFVPITSLLCLLISFALKMNGGSIVQSKFSSVLLKASGFLFAVFVVYKVIVGLQRKSTR